MVVISSGDEIRLEFAVPETAPPPGWTRDFILHCCGWDKDADLNTLSGQSTGALAVSRDDAVPAAGQMKWRNVPSSEQQNRHHLQRYQSFRSFWYRSLVEQPMSFHQAGESLIPERER